MRLSSVCKLFLRFSASTFVAEKLLTSALTCIVMMSCKVSPLRTVRSAKDARHLCLEQCFR